MVTGVNAGESSRWPALRSEKRADDSEGLWARGKLHDAWRGTGRLEASSACSGEVPNDGVARFPAAECGVAPAMASSLIPCAKQGGKGSRRRATTRGGEGARRERRGSTESPGSFEERPRQQRVPAKNFVSLAAESGVETEGK